MFEGKDSVISRARRDFLTAGSVARNAHIASVLVQALPEHLAGIVDAVNALEGIESHGGNEDAGKLILTIEVDSDAALVEAIGRIERTDKVITATLIYHHMEQADGVMGDA